MARVTVEVPEEETNTEENVQAVPEQPETAPTEPITEAQPVIPATPKKLKISPQKLVIAGVVILIIVLVAMLINSNSDKDKLKQTVDKETLGAQTQAEDEAKSLKQEIGQFLELPADEIPTVATVADASKVKNQSFFANSQNGDKVLIFSKAGKAVLYRPSTKKIIEVAPINLNNSGQSSPTTSQQQTTTPPPTNRR